MGYENGRMAALFTAFDRPNYQKIIPQHIVDMLTIPKEVLSNLQQGGFTVSRGHVIPLQSTKHTRCVSSGNVRSLLPDHQLIISIVLLSSSLSEQKQ